MAASPSGDAEREGQQSSGSRHLSNPEEKRPLEGFDSTLVNLGHQGHAQRRDFLRQAPFEAFNSKVQHALTPSGFFGFEHLEETDSGLVTESFPKRR
jgi:hypothetical protein